MFTQSFTEWFEETYPEDQFPGAAVDIRETLREVVQKAWYAGRANMTWEDI